MAIRINQNTVAEAGKCDCGGDIDCFRDIEVNKWYAQCQNCGHTGRYAVDWRRALARFRQTPRKRMTEKQAKILLESLRDLQNNPVENSIPFPCPRCGQHRMKAKAEANSLSRYEDLYICNVCGRDEAIRELQEMQPLPLDQWGMIRGFSA